MLQTHEFMLKKPIWGGIGRDIRLQQCGEEHCGGGHSFGPAIRNNYLIHCILEGYGILEIGRKRYSLGPGEAFLIRPGERAYYKADAELPWYYCWVGFSGAEAAEMIEQLRAGSGPVFRFRGGEEAGECIRMMRENLGAYGSRFQLYSALYRFLSLLENFPERRKQDASVARQAAAYIMENYSYSITVEQIADFIGVHRSHLFREMKLYYHQSPQQYLLAVRLKKASELLSGGVSVKEAAYSTGFVDASYFSRQFKKRFGVCPSGWEQKWP